MTRTCARRAIARLLRVARGAGVALLALVALAADAGARPTYFDTLTGLYAITPADDLYACGVCHYRWTGTGARNPYGSAVEQQLYLGKSITRSLQDVEAADSDGDGFVNVDELVTFRTLPGYSCANFHLAIGAPPDYHTFVTPMVASCLEPLDIRVAPSQIALLVRVGNSESATVEVFNNGSDFAVTVSAYGLVAGSHPAFGVSGPAAPFAIPLGASVLLEVAFTPATALSATGTLRISSDDPDEPDVDVALSGVGFLQPLAPDPERAACLREIDRRFQRYGRTHLKEWGRCYAAEVAGIACDAGRRTMKLQQAEAKLRAKVGGDADRACGGRGLTPSLLGLPPVCGGTCGGLAVNSLATLVDCLLCRQDEAMAAALASAVGTTPPDLPLNRAGSKAAASCQARLISGMQRGIAKVQKTLGACALANVTATTPLACETARAADLARIAATVDAQLVRCRDTTGLLACPLEPGADPECLGTSARAIGAALVEAVFAGTE